MNTSSYIQFKNEFINSVIFCAAYNERNNTLVSHVETKLDGIYADVIYIDAWHDDYEGHADIRIQCEDEMVADLIRYNLEKNYRKIWDKTCGSQDKKEAVFGDLDALAALKEKMEKGE